MTLRQRVLSYDRGLSSREVATQLGVSRNVVIGHRWRSRRPSRPRKPRPPRPIGSAIADNLIDLMADGRVRTLSEIAERLNVKVSWAGRLLRRYVEMGLIERVGFGLYQDQSD